MTAWNQLLQTARRMVSKLVHFIAHQLAERRAAKPRRYMNG
ncbi:hypothetical protein ACQKKX_02935 [Neorhizobium sp. NPDC001467]